MKELEFEKEGILVLGIYRNIKRKEIFIGAPNKNIKLLPKNKLVCYGLEDSIIDLSKRLRGRIGDIMHETAVKQEKIRKKKEEY